MVKPKALLLDFYGTLVHEDDAVIRTICESIHQHTPDRGTVTPADISHAWWTRFRTVSDTAVGTAFLSQRDIARTSLAATIDDFQATCDPDTLLTAQFAYWQAPQLFPDTAALLALPLPVCIVSNIDRDDLEAALSHHDLTTRVQHVVTSEDAHSYKPRPEMFTTALDLLASAAHEVLHVGDSVASDVIGATRLGIPVAWVNRRARPLPPQRPTWDVRSLADVVQLLA